MNELPKMPAALSVQTKSERMQQKMQALAMSMLKHFDLIVWGLRVAGGARRP